MKKYKTEFSKEELHNALNKHSDEAMTLIQDVNRWTSFKEKIEKVIEKAEKIPVLGRIIDDLVCMVALVDSYVKKEYQDVPIGTIISIVAALIYVISPIDLVPDAIPVIGYVDDVAVIMLILGTGVNKDLKKYQKWQEGNREVAIGKLAQGIADEIDELLAESFLVGFMISDENMIRMLISKEEKVICPIECYVKTLKVPVELLDDYGICELKEYIELFDRIVKLDVIHWASGIEKRAYYEPDFDERWDDYIIKG